MPKRLALRRRSDWSSGSSVPGWCSCLLLALPPVCIRQGGQPPRCDLGCTSSLSHACNPACHGSADCCTAPLSVSPGRRSPPMVSVNLGHLRSVPSKRTAYPSAESQTRQPDCSAGRQLCQPVWPTLSCMHVQKSNEVGLMSQSELLDYERARAAQGGSSSTGW